jgi:hypothetical protein
MRNFTYLSNFYFHAYTVIFRIALAQLHFLALQMKHKIIRNMDSKVFPESVRHISYRDTFPNEPFHPGGSFSGLWIHRSPSGILRGLNVAGASAYGQSRLCRD